eukprot:CAMPEP_0119052492 /NCGR_PEP_ID=MMETSP1177-20130426/73773_1 /TAXON_ID=2985 /ORGANISM="Ochromonas sp, Strain CCMP1899" /LENGTH=87 /DNA_ID=CAMNT_0007032079 /DNA_START=217 /DNA_END=480 /DNA_ORIENTATION=+
MIFSIRMSEMCMLDVQMIDIIIIKVISYPGGGHNGVQRVDKSWRGGYNGVQRVDKSWGGGYNGVQRVNKSWDIFPSFFYSLLIQTEG